MVPFAEVILLTAMEYFREEEGLEQNGNLTLMDVSEEESEAKDKGCPSPRMWIPQLKTLEKKVLPSMVLASFVIYFVVAAFFYFNAQFIISS